MDGSSQQITLSSEVQASKEVLESKVGNEIVLLDIEKGQYFGMDEIGSAIWERLKEPIQVSSLVDQLVEQFDAERAEIEADTLEFLAKIQENQILEFIDSV